MRTMRYSGAVQMPFVAPRLEIECSKTCQILLLTSSDPLFELTLGPKKLVMNGGRFENGT
jgi:hypothetical protein